MSDSPGVLQGSPSLLTHPASDISIAMELGTFTDVCVPILASLVEIFALTFVVEATIFVSVLETFEVTFVVEALDDGGLS